MLSDIIPTGYAERLAQARSFGCETVDLSINGNLPEQIDQIIGSPEVDSAIDCGDPGAMDEDSKIGTLKIRFGLGWAKSHTFVTGQTPVMKYHRELMMSILGGRAQIAKAVNATMISLDKAPQAYKDFDRGVSRKFVIVPHGLVR
jgi:glutathione-independent formaldehyde dehydrogenase